MPADSLRLKQDDLDHLGELVEAIGERYIERLKGDGGKQIAVLMRDYAWNHARHDTGTMRDSITTADNRDTTVTDTSVTVRIGCSAYYSIFQEYGTGTKGDPVIPHVQKDFWFQFDGYDDEGNAKFIKRYAQSPTYFMKRAITDKGQISLFKSVLMGEAKKVFKG